MLLLAAPALAADLHLEVTAGLRPQARRDELFSPVPHDALGVGGVAGLWLDGRADGHHVALGLDHAALRGGPDWTFTSPEGEVLERGPSTVVGLEPRWAWGRRTGTGDGPALHLGGTLASRIEAGQWTYGPGSTLVYLGAFGLGPWGRLRADTRAGGLELEAWAPLASWIARPPLALNDDPYMRATSSHGPLDVLRLIGDGRPETLITWRSVHLRGAWDLPIGGALTPRLGARFDLVSERDPRPLIGWQLGAELGFAWSPT